MNFLSIFFLLFNILYLSIRQIWIIKIVLKEKIYIFFYLVFAFYESSRKLRIRNISLLEYVGTYQGFPEVTSTFISNREKHRNWTKYRMAEEKSFWLNTSLRRRPIIGTDYFRGARGYYGNEIEVTTIETVSVDTSKIGAHWTNKLFSSRSHEERFFAG